MAYRNEPLQHLYEDGIAHAQVVAPPDFPGDKNPPMNNIATSRYTTRCSYCLEPINVGNPFEVCFCDGCGEPETDDHTFVVGTCCNTDLAELIAGNFVAIDAPLPIGTHR